MSRRTRLLLVAFALAPIAAYSSDSLLLALPDSLTRHFEGKLARRYERDGVAALWTFDDPAVTEALSGTRAVNFGTLLTAGRYGRARAFDGGEDTYISTGLRWTSLGEHYTISAWVKLNRSSPDQSLVYTEGAVRSGLTLSGGRMVLAVPHTQSQTASYPFASYGRFVNVTGVVDLRSGTAALYEDGVLQATTDVRGVTHGGDVIEFGKARPYHVYQPLDGVLDQTVIWRRALSPAEVRTVAQSPHALERQVGSGYILGRRTAAAVTSGIGSVLKVVDHFNPMYHAAHLHEAELPVFSLALSRRDLRSLARARAQGARTGSSSARASARRRVDLVFNGAAYEAEMAPYGDDPQLWLNSKPSFRLHVDGLVDALGARTFVFVPPEASGLLRPLLHRQLAERYGLPDAARGLAIVRINGRQLGLYHFRADPPPVGGVVDVDGFPESLAGLPVSGDDVLRQYDALRARVEPLLLHDKTSSWPTRAVRYRIRSDREALARWVERSRGGGEPAEVARVADYLTEQRVLRGNPAASYVIGDLDLSGPRLPGTRITWTSSDARVIAPDGTVVRPAGREAAAVRLEASIARGPAAAHRTLHFTVMPRRLELPALRLRVPGPFRSTHRTACVMEFIEEDGDRRTGWLGCAVKLRGNTTLFDPKKSFSLRLETGYRFPGFSASRIVHLIASHPDPSLMKNKLAYDVFRSFAEPESPRYSPRVRLVELFLNDEYYGIYQLSERVDRFLLNLSRSRESAPSVIYKAKHSDASLQRLARHAYAQIEPDADDGRVWEPLEQLIQFVGQADREAFARDVEKWIDIPAYIDFAILANLFANREGLRFNLYLARDAAPGSRFIVIPWDYDKSLLGPPSGWLSNFLLHRLATEVPGFPARLQRRWRELRSRQLAEPALQRRIDEIDRTLAGSVAREFTRWPRRHAGYHETVRDMRAWIAERLRGLDRLIAEM